MWDNNYAAIHSIMNQELPQNGITSSLFEPSRKVRRLAIVSTASINRRTGPHLVSDAEVYRVISDGAELADLIISYAPNKFDRVEFRECLFMVFLIDELRDMEAHRETGSAAAHRYSFNGTTPLNAHAGDA